MERAIANCLGGVVVGAIGGAILGEVFGGNPGSGAAIGAAVGVGRCAILVQLAAEEDKQKLREAELAALEANTTTTRSIVTQSGKTATVTTRVSNAPIPQPKKLRDKPSAPGQTTAQDGEPPRQSAASSQQAEAPPATSQGPSEQLASAPDATPTTAEPPSPIQMASFAEERQSYSECRYTEMLIAMEGGEADGGKQKWCKSVTGSWEPITG